MNQETYWKIRLSKFVVPYYYLKCILFIIFNCFKIAKSYDDCLNILGQCDPDKNNHGLMHLKVKSRTKIIDWDSYDNSNHRKKHFCVRRNKNK